MALSIKHIIMYLSFILWFIYIFLSTIKEVNVKESIKESYLKYFKKNFWRLFRIDKLVLIIIFYIYTLFGKETVNVYLFLSMICYLLVNLLYENINFKKVNWSKNWLYFLFILLIAIIPIVIYFLSKKIMVTYLLMFLIIFFFPGLFVILSLFIKKD